MNKQGLIESIRYALGGTATPMAAAYALKAVLQSIQEGLHEEESVKISDFGQFTIVERAARCIFNPKTGSYYQSKAHRHVKFKAAPKQHIISPPQTRA